MPIVQKSSADLNFLIILKNRTMKSGRDLKSKRLKERLTTIQDSDFRIQTKLKDSIFKFASVILHVFYFLKSYSVIL